MSTGKVYGRDGPPQLQGRTEDVPVDVLNEWAARGAYWLRPARARAGGEWEKLVRCPCGHGGLFDVRSADSDTPGWVHGDPYGGTYRCDLQCANCGEAFVLFDDGVHGYNAVVCDERAFLPPGYVESNGAVLEPLVCDCGGRRFSVIVGAMYDCGDGLDDLPESQWDDAYGSFSAHAKCGGCGRIHELVEAETA